MPEDTKQTEAAGDRYFGRKEYDLAVEEYVKSLDSINPSVVIRKFLEAQRIENLTIILEALFDRKQASPEHVTLLLNCYVRLGEVERLERFIQTHSEAHFDEEKVITACREAGFFDQAALIAEKRGESDLYISLQIEELKNYSKALQHIQTLPPSSVGANLFAHGTKLLRELPEATVQLFLDYYLGVYEPKMKELVNDSSPTTSKFSALRNYAAYLPHLSSTISPVVSIASSRHAANSTFDVAKRMSPPIRYQPPKPRSAFPLFVDQRLLFIRFLEAMLAHESIGGNLSSADNVVGTTLFELYLQEADSREGNEREEWREKTKQLLIQAKVPMDECNILLLAHLGSYVDGIRIINEREGRIADIFRGYLAQSDPRKVIAALRQYGLHNPDLYPLALKYLCSEPNRLAEYESEVQKILKEVQERGLMAPLQVLQLFKDSTYATVGLVKPFLLSVIEKERKEIEMLVESYQEETRKKNSEIEEFQNGSRIFQSTRCTKCAGHLDLPVIHFMCKHSFHKSCLAGSEVTECPKCITQNKTIRAILASQEGVADRYDLFKAALQQSKNKFKVIADWISKGVMSVSFR